MSCGVGRRRDTDLALLWPRPAAVAPIGPWAWEPPYAMGAALRKKIKRQKKKKKVSNVFETNCLSLLKSLTVTIWFRKTNEREKINQNYFGLLLNHRKLLLFDFFLDPQKWKLHIVFSWITEKPLQISSPVGMFSKIFSFVLCFATYTDKYIWPLFPDQRLFSTSRSLL